MQNTSKDYFLVFYADNKPQSNYGVLSNRKLMEIAPNVYGSWITIIDGYTTLDEKTCIALMKSGWGHLLSDFRPMYALNETGDNIFEIAEIEMEFPYLSEYGGIDHLRRQYAISLMLAPVILD